MTDTTTENPEPGGGPAAATTVPVWVQISVAVIAVVFFGWFVFYLLDRAATDTDLAWTRRVYVFGSVEAIVFTVIGWVFGREVNRRQAQTATEQADKARTDAEAATRKAEQATVDATRAEERGRALRQAIFAKSADRSQLRRAAFAPSPEAAAALESDVGELATLAESLFPDPMAT